MRNPCARSARSVRAIPLLFAIFISLSVSRSMSVLQAQCPDPTTAIVETQLDDEGNGGGSLAMRECGEFIVVWERDYYTGGSYNNIDALRFRN